jgi:hypothetical protein
MYDRQSLGCVANSSDFVGAYTTLLCGYDATTTYAFFGNENDAMWSSVSFDGGDDCFYDDKVSDTICVSTDTVSGPRQLVVLGTSENLNPTT